MRKLFFVLFFISSSLYAQSEYGINTGLNTSTFYNFTKDDGYYKSHYSAYAQYAITGFYKEPFRNNQYIGLELEWKAVKSRFDVIDVYSRFYSYPRNIVYTLNYLYLYLTHQKVYTPSYKVKLLSNFCPYFAYLIQSKAVGDDMLFGFSVYKDSIGNIYNVPYSKSYTKNESPTKDIENINAGLRLGIAIQFKLNPQLDMIIENNYNIGLVNVVAIAKKHTGLFDISFTVGILFKDPKNRLRLYRQLENSTL
jgi:hypothetical protein